MYVISALYDVQPYLSVYLTFCHMYLYTLMLVHNTQLVSMEELVQRKSWFNGRAGSMEELVQWTSWFNKVEDVDSWLLNVPSIRRVYLRDRSAETIVKIIALKGAIRDSYNLLTALQNCLQHVRSSSPGAIVH